MTTTNGPIQEPLWLAIETKISGLSATALSGEGLEAAIQEVAGSLDADGFSVSRNAGHMLAIRGSVKAAAAVGRPLMKDLSAAFGALTLETVSSPYQATAELIDQVGETWPALRDSARMPDIMRIVERTRLDLLVAEAKALGGDAGVRFLIQEKVQADVVVSRLEISQGEFDRVMAEVKAERVERARVRELLGAVAEKAPADRIRHLITSDVAEALIVELAEVGQGDIDAVKQAMEAEIAEKQRLAEEAAAKKAAEAAGPSLEDISPDDMLEHIEAIREILDFSDVEKEIRVMCEQSGVPVALVDIAVSDPDRLDELEAAAEG